MLKNVHIWIMSYFAQAIRRAFSPRIRGLKHIIFCVADHFEPRWGNVSPDKELERVDAWLRKYEPVAGCHRDSDGKIPQYTFFYPIDEYAPQAFEKIARFCEKGYGEIEIQLHHDNDTEESLRKKLERAKDVFGKRQYGFVHGNWSLGNSRRDGKWCGVNNELAVLKETGCYADFTMPSAPSETQTRKINSIYYAKDTGAPKPHNAGIDAEVGKMQNDGLMIIQGPLALNWKRMKIENSGITMENPPAKDRINLWVRQGIGVKESPDWVFVKVYAHGAQDANLTDGYFKNLDNMFAYLEEKYDDKVNYKLHYVSAREMYNIVKAAEAGLDGEPEEYRDYEIKNSSRLQTIDRRPETNEYI
jgi:hypothetical protein